MKSNNSVEQDYSDFYDRFWSDREFAPPDPLSDKRIEVFAREFTGHNNVLDAGCGKGYCSAKLSQRGFRVSGMDLSEGAIQMARERYPNIRFAVGSFDSLIPYKDCQFDAIYCAEVVEHVVDTQNMVKELYRVLRPRGGLLISAPYHGLMKNLLIALFAFERHFSPIGPHIRFFTIRSLSELLTSAGFSVTNVIRLGRVGYLLYPKNIVVIAYK